LDACALIAVLAMEKGADNIKKLFQKTIDRQIVLMMSKFNFLEVYYKIYRAYGKKDTLTDEVFKEAGRLKSKYKISIADSIAVAETIINITWFR
jgi:predicted nucleic acid-binding protein